MPIAKIETSEYECMHCGHKWINRVNGKDGPIPKKCAKCKRMHWNGWDQKYEPDPNKAPPITPEERSLRMRLYKFEGTLNRALGYGTQYRPNELCKTFLGLKPRPNMNELIRALWPLGWDTRSRKYKNFIRDPDRSGYLKYDVSRLIRDPKDPDNRDKMKYNDDPDFITDYQKLLDEESLKRKHIMKEVIKSRGVKFQEPISVPSAPEKKEAQAKVRKTYDELLTEIRDTLGMKSKHKPGTKSKTKSKSN